MSWEGILTLLLGLTVQILEERGQHADIGWLIPVAHDDNSIFSFMQLKSRSSTNLSQDYIFTNAICTNNARIIYKI